MNRSINLNSNLFMDSTGITHNRRKLSEILEEIETKKDKILIYEGAASSGDSIQINTTWQNLSKFKRIVIELDYGTTNSWATCFLDYESLASGSYLNSNKLERNVYSNTAHIYDKDVSLHLIPSENITSNTIKFDWNYNEIKIERIWVEY